MTVSFPLTLPAVATVSIALRRRNVVAANVAPGSLVPQVYRHPGQRWELTLMFGMLARATAAPWLAVLNSLDSAYGSFIWGPPRYTSPLGTAAGSPVVSSTTAAGSRTLPVSGGTGTLLAGSKISIGSGSTRRMYEVLTDVASLASATLDIWPPLRAQAASSTPISLTSPSCVFQLAPGSVVEEEENIPGHIKIGSLAAWEDLR